MVILNLFEIIHWKGCFAQSGGIQGCRLLDTFALLSRQPLTANHPECQ